MDASLIVSNYEPKGHLLTCVGAALAQDLPPDRFEVIVPVHGEVSSADRTGLEALAGAAPGRLRLLPGPFADRSAALNAASAAAHGETLIFLESHVTAPSHLTTALLECLRSTAASAVQGDFQTREVHSWVAGLESRLRMRANSRRMARGQPGDEWHLHSVAIQRTVFVAAVGFIRRLLTLPKCCCSSVLTVSTAPSPVCRNRSSPTSTTMTGGTMSGLSRDAAEASGSCGTWIRRRRPHCSPCRPGLAVCAAVAGCPSWRVWCCAATVACARSVFELGASLAARGFWKPLAPEPSR